ncbi:hypothetical protein NY536_02135, partial [Enterobacter hormaechei]|nr:hypothetical protein [Enterobacter hormaechei]
CAPALQSDGQVYLSAIPRTFLSSLCFFCVQATIMLMGNRKARYGILHGCFSHSKHCIAQAL